MTRRSTLLVLAALAAMTPAAVAQTAPQASVPATPQTAPVAADAGFCGGPSGEPAQLLDRVKAVSGVVEVHRDREYVAYQDPATQTMYTFTLAGQPAHPTAVCRKPVQAGDALELQMVIVCKGTEKTCAQLEGDFKLLNAKMQADINNQIQAGRK